MNHGHRSRPGSKISRIPSQAARPEVAVVIPVYKHSVLLEEAVISALNQQTDFALAVVIVNDGCPMPETHQTCLEFAMAAPDRVSYIRRQNGGLSAARNTGIDHVLATWETVEAIYFLDADNRLFPNALQRAYAALAGDPERRLGLSGHRHVRAGVERRLLGRVLSASSSGGKFLRGG